MRWILAAVLGVAALLGAGVGLAAAIDHHGIYYSSQAEAEQDLVSFGQLHPACSIWSNWQKACSRTGRGGAPLCQKAAVSVQPSKAFCAARYEDDIGGPHADDAHLEIASFLRFCNVPADFAGDYEERREICEWDPNRPFNGRRLEELKHPWCEHWEKTPDLSATRERPKSLGAYYCAKRKIENWCDWADGMGLGPQKGLKLEPDREIIPLRWSSRSAPMHRTFCRRVSSHAG